ncbi:phage tail protein [Paraburkholderia antibiotica]|uniref:Phage tail protein n=1 Tax=Paraburkholderia antibiotica TaxID=2728839 RepID=A0A7X9X5F0_9BURK|nr:phage tail protein [Paraburkholderia antibiotica]NML31787.1 phage tail protein [Paraburkholderia antibiotica]
MKKIDSLRAAITAAYPRLADNPDSLMVFIDHGSVTGTATQSASFQWTYVAWLVLTDFAGDNDMLMSAILEWAKSHQPDLLENRDNASTGITFEADILNNACVDLSIRVRLVERAVEVRNADGTRSFKRVDDSLPGNINQDSAGWLPPRDAVTGTKPIDDTDP